MRPGSSTDWRGGGAKAGGGARADGGLSRVRVAPRVCREKGSARGSPQKRVKCKLEPVCVKGSGGGPCVARVVACCVLARLLGRKKKKRAGASSSGFGGTPPSPPTAPSSLQRPFSPPNVNTHHAHTRTHTNRAPLQPQQRTSSTTAPPSALVVVSLPSSLPPLPLSLSLSSRNPPHLTEHRGAQGGP